MSERLRDDELLAIGAWLEDELRRGQFAVTVEIPKLQLMVTEITDLRTKLAAAKERALKAEARLNIAKHKSDEATWDRLLEDYHREYDRADAADERVTSLDKMLTNCHKEWAEEVHKRMNIQERLATVQAQLEQATPPAAATNPTHEQVKARLFKNPDIKKAYDELPVVVDSMTEAEQSRIRERIEEGLN